MHSKRNYTIPLFFILICTLVTSCKSETTFFKKSSNVFSETKATLCNLVRKHPYVTTGLVWLLLRYLTAKLADSSYGSRPVKMGDYKIDVRKDVYHTALNPKCAIVAAFLVDYLNNQSHSLPSRCVSHLHALVKTYSESTNLEFIHKSFDWTVDTIKSVPSVILS